MKMMTCATMAALLTGAAACNQASTAQGRDPAVVTFEARPALSESAEALPRLVGEGKAIAAINADLDRLDAGARADCEGEGGFERGGLSQPMMGPGFISFSIYQGQFCEGAARPDTTHTAITYDLATGQAVDWVAAAPGLQLTRGDATGQAADYVPGFSSAALLDWYSAKAMTSPDPAQREQCADVWTPESMEGTEFQIWLDARNGGLSVQPRFPHVVMACADTATLNPEEMRRFGISPRIIDAVAAAHAAGSWAPKEDQGG